MSDRISIIMMKRLAILAVLFAVISSAPLPGQTASPAASASGGPQDDSHTQQKTPTPSVPVINAPQAPNPQEHSVNQEGTKENVTVSTTEPLKVQADVSKDWMDKLNWLLSAILVVIGVCGVLYARKTLKAIEGQLTEIRAAGKQTDQMIKHAGTQAGAAVLNAQYVIDTERGWLSITMGDVKLPYKDIPADSEVWFSPRVMNIGKNQTHITKMYLRARYCTSIREFRVPPLYENEPDPPEDGSSRLFGAKLFEENVMVVPNATMMPIRVKTTGQELRQLTDGGNTKLFVYGYVEYRTIGHPTCTTGFCLQYHIPGAITDALEGLPLGWAIYGPPGYNYAD
jgi:hypothetical protein